MGTVIDVHNHFYPANYLDELRDMDSNVSIASDEEGRQVILSGDSRVVTLTPPMTELEVRLEAMDKAGIDHQVLSLSVPNVNFLPGERSYEIAQLCNDAYAEINDNYDEFSALASIPLRAPELAVQEADRAINDLGLNGFIIGSNINDTPLNDDQFRPFFEKVAELDAPLFIHPMAPAGNEVMEEYRLAPLVGFENEITLAITRLIFEGVLEQLDIDIHLAHLGGTVPYLIERLNNGYRAYPECRENISHPPEYYLQDVYYDTVSFHQPALKCALESVGADQLLLGSDYPHVIGDLARSKTDILDLPLTHAERSRILGSNAASLFGI